MIPKRIFYCWLTKDESNPGLPNQFKVAVDQWKSIAKPELGWEYVFVDWDYMKSNYGDEVIAEMRKVAAVQTPAVVADYCRFVVTITKGGFYMDLDTIISPGFLRLVDSEVPIISARPGVDLQFMCHPGGLSAPKDIFDGRWIYEGYGKMIVGNYSFFSPSRNHTYLRNKIMRALPNRIPEKFDIVNIIDFDCPGQPHTVLMKFFYFNQPLFHFDFNDHDGVKLGFEEKFKYWENEFLTYYESHHN